MKPKPFSLLNHFTVPVAMGSSFQSSQPARGSALVVTVISRLLLKAKHQGTDTNRCNVPLRLHDRVPRCPASRVPGSPCPDVAPPRVTAVGQPRRPPLRSSRCRPFGTWDRRPRRTARRRAPPPFRGPPLC